MIGNSRIQRGQKIDANVWIIILVDNNSRGGVKHRNMTGPALYPRGQDYLANATGNVHALLEAVGINSEYLGHVRSGHASNYADRVENSTPEAP